MNPTSPHITGADYSELPSTQGASYASERDLLQAAKAWSAPLKDPQDQLTWAALWGLHIKSARCYRGLIERLTAPQLSRSEPHPPSESSHQARLEALEQTLQGEALLRAQLLALSAHELDQDLIKSRAEGLSDELSFITRDTSFNDLELAARVLSLTHELRLLKRLAAHALNIKEPYQADLIHEVFGMSEGDGLGQLLETSELYGRFTRLYQSGLEREVLFLEQALSSTDEPSAQRWRLLMWAGELQVNISGNPQSTPELVTRCATARLQLHQQLDEAWRAAPPSEALLDELAWALSHHMSDLLGRIDHTELERSIQKLECIQSDLAWFSAYAPQSKADHKALMKRAPSLAKAFELLKKKRQLVRAELQEKRLQHALEALFGERLVARFEQLIVSLIFLVLGLLFFELLFVHEDNVELRKTLALIDTGICVVFLVEFFTKLSLSDDKRFYFKRRWFIDLLPSIPFVLFTDYFLLDHLASGRAAKLARLSRLVRYIRIARPFIRAIRLISFTLRGLDRFVKRYSKWLNKNIVFFEPNQSIHAQRKLNSFEVCHEVYAHALHELRFVSSRLDHHDLPRLLPVYVTSIERHLDWKKAPIALGLRASQEGGQRNKDIPVEQAINILLHLRGAQLETYLGSDFPRYVHFYVGLFDVPVLRHLPVLRTVLEKRRHSSSSELSAWIVRGFGRLLEAIMNLGYWFADLYGILTGPKIIDRVGNTLIKTFQNPAKRFLIFGVLLLLSHVIVSALDVPFFAPALSLMQKLFGLPVIILGLICLVPFILGMRMVRIAGQATELYRLTSEAQYINLLKELKEKSASADLELLYERVLEPESLLTADEPLGEVLHSFERQEVFLERALKQLDERLSSTGQTALKTHDPAVVRAWWREHKVIMLYRDYLDGALLHDSDVKSTEQLLGNISLRNLIDYKLNLTPKELEGIERLDLSKHRSLFGPYMWFSLITQSVSQNTAQLLLEYNRFAIPLEELPHRPQASRELYDAWRLDKRKEQSDNSSRFEPIAQPLNAEGEPLSLDEPRPELPRFEHADFSSLHLLTDLSQYEGIIKERFGEEVYEHLSYDQKKLIRGIFSSYPLYKLPRAQRTLNPYQIYQEHLLGGRVFLLPFKLIGLAFSLIATALRWIKEKINEIRFPEQKTVVLPQKDFVVAKRKINRTRKPIFMKLMDLRSRLDVEYLGLPFDDSAPPSPPKRPLFEEDLDHIHAIELERKVFRQRQLEVQGLLKELRPILAREGLSGEALSEQLRARFPSLVGREREVSRALTMAYVTDFKYLRSYLEVSFKLKELFEDTLSGEVHPLRLHEQLLKLSGRATGKLTKVALDKERRAFKVFWVTLGYAERSQEDFERCWKRYFKELRSLKSLMALFDKGPLDQGLIFDEVIQYCDAWSQELMTLRMVQTLTLMDVRNYRQYIWKLGAYDQDDLPASAPPPMGAPPSASSMKHTTSERPELSISPKPL